MNDYRTCTVGIDLGDRKSVACVSAQGAVVEWFAFAMTREGVRAAFAGKGYGRVVMGEAAVVLAPAGWPEVSTKAADRRGPRGVSTLNVSRGPARPDVLGLVQAG